MNPRAITLLAALVVPGRAVENSVLDPSFEAPAAASQWRPSDGASRLTAEYKRTGTQSLRLDNQGQGAAARDIHQAVQTAMPVAGVSPGREYVFSVQVKAENVTGVGAGGKPLVVLRWRDAADQKIAEELYDWAPYGTYDFQKRVLHLQAPAGAAKIDVGFRSWWDCLTGTTWWDDASLAPRVVPGRGALLATYEAEIAALRIDGKVADVIPGYTGTGYFEATASGALLEWDDVAGGGDRVIAVRYSWEGAARPLELLVNGASQGRKTPVGTGRRGSYATENWTTRLPAGRNTVRLVVQSQGNSEKIRPLIDRLEVYANRDRFSRGAFTLEQRAGVLHRQPPAQGTTGSAAR